MIGGCRNDHELDSAYYCDGDGSVDGDRICGAICFCAGLDCASGGEAGKEVICDCVFLRFALWWVTLCLALMIGWYWGGPLVMRLINWVKRNSR